MRSFDDDQGGHWQAALMEASFGNILLVFSRIGAPGALAKTVEAATFPEAEQLLATADDAWLRTVLASARPWP